MSDELNLPSDELNTDDSLEISDETDDSGADEEYEEICSDEVDRVVAALEELIESVKSENVQAYLEEASTHVYSLIYDEEDEELEEAA